MHICIDGSTLTIEMTGWERTLAVHPGQIPVTIENIERAYVGWPRHGWRQLRVPDTMLPGVVKAGTYRWRCSHGEEPLMRVNCAADGESIIQRGGRYGVRVD